jgi:dynein heavy chain
VYGLYIEGARWARERGCLDEQNPGEMNSSMPIIHFLPQEVARNDPGANKRPKQDETDMDDALYKCPVYKTSVRAGVLSTTGQSTNFILSIDLPCSENETPEHWTLRATALLTMLND